MLRIFPRDRRGTASLEAAVMLPIMALCWAGLFFRARSLENFLDAAAVARRDAWAFSNSGCEENKPEGTTVGCQGDGTGESWMNALSEIPLLGELIGAITGFKLIKIETREHDAPILLGSIPSKQSYSYSLMCNEVSRGNNYLLAFVLCEEVRRLGLDLSFAVDCPPPPPNNDKCPE